MKKRTGYNNEAEFNKDIQEHEAGADDIVHAVRNDTELPEQQKLDRNDPAAQRLRSALGDTLRRHNIRDNNYKAAFKEAIDKDGNVVNDDKQNKALRESTVAIERLEKLRKLAQDAKVNDGGMLLDTINNELANEKDINSKMHERIVPARATRDINGKEVSSNPGKDTGKLMQWQHDGDTGYIDIGRLAAAMGGIGVQ